MGDTRSKRIERLQDRRDYLDRRLGERRAAGDPEGFIVDEIRALDWALPILREHIRSTHGLASHDHRQSA